MNSAQDYFPTATFNYPQYTYPPSLTASNLYGQSAPAYPSYTATALPQAYAFSSMQAAAGTAALEASALAAQNGAVNTAQRDDSSEDGQLSVNIGRQPSAPPLSTHGYGTVHAAGGGRRGGGGGEQECHLTLAEMVSAKGGSCK